MCSTILGNKMISTFSLLFSDLDARLHELGVLMRKADEIFEDAAKVLGYMVLIPCESFYKRMPDNQNCHRIGTFSP